MVNNKFDLLDNIELTSENKEYFKYSEMVNEIIIQLITRRLELDMSQRALAEKTGIKQPMIARIEKFESIPRIDTLVKIAYALGLTISFIENIDNSSGLSVSVKRDYYRKVINDNNSILYLCENEPKYNKKSNKEKNYKR